VLGTFDLTLVETTPIVFGGELWLFEAVHQNYWNTTQDTPYDCTALARGTVASTDCRTHQRFVNVHTGEQSSLFGQGHFFGSAIVDNTTGVEIVYVFGTRGCATLHTRVITATHPGAISFWSVTFESIKYI
jgi:hypothetical protein